MEVSEFLRNCREHYPSLPEDDLLSVLRCKMEPAPDGEPDDVNAEFREALCRELNRTLQKEDRYFIHYLLEQEILYHRALPGGVYFNIQRCAYLLFRLGYVDDSLLIWRAKTVNFDTHCGVDVQLLVGAGVEDTIAWLKNEGSLDAQNAVSWIEGCLGTGDFKNLAGYRESANSTSTTLSNTSL